MKAGTIITHGRSVTIYNHGVITDGFLKENIVHGPRLAIRIDGIYSIMEHEDGVEVSSKSFRIDGTPILVW